MKKIELTRDVAVAGEHYKKGDVLEVDSSTAFELVTAGSAVKLDVSDEKPTPPKKLNKTSTKEE